MPNASAPTSSEAIITFLRSKRSPTCPAKGPTNPPTPNVSSNVADNQPGEWFVRA